MKKFMIILFSILMSSSCWAPTNNSKISEVTREVREISTVLDNISTTEKYNLLNLPLFPIISGQKQIKVNSKYGFRSHPILKRYLKHDGIDINASIKDTAMASGNGIIIEVKKLRFGYGNHVIIQHENGYQTLYAHLNKILVSKGDTVKIGQPIGTIGRTGLATGVHLHYEIRKNNESIDPMELLNCKTENEFINTTYILNKLGLKYNLS